MPYFVGTVKARCGDDCYIIQDGLGDLEKIWREDIIANDDSSDQTIHVSDIQWLFLHIKKCSVAKNNTCTQNNCSPGTHHPDSPV